MQQQQSIYLTITKSKERKLSHTMPSATISLTLALCLVLLNVCCWSTHARSTASSSPPNSNPKPSSFLPRRFATMKLLLTTRGGDDTNTDDERYSRQVYTLGARAHGLVRTCTIYVDGPTSSGLVYECVKNLALSGVGNIELWDAEEEALDKHYHDSSLDDLGKAFQRAARHELDLLVDDDSKEEEASEKHVLAEYIKRLNPSVKVSMASRNNRMEGKKHDLSSSSRGVILCIDRPYATQVKLNRWARQQNLAFVAVETAGVYGKIFCDFGPNFEVYDSDGETPLVTPLDRIEMSKAPEDEQEKSIIMVYCVDAEKHDVSKGDKIQFQKSNGHMMPEQCTVEKVLTPQRFKIRLDSSSEQSTGNENLQEEEEFCNRVNQETVSFSRIKIPTEISFVSLEDALQQIKDGSGDELFTACDLDKSFDGVRRDSVMACFQALSAFVDSQQRLPTLKESMAFQNILMDTTKNVVGEENNVHIQNFVRTCAAKLVPLQAMFGAVGAQEALKAATGLYNPVRQLLLYDCDELMREKDTCENVTVHTKSGKPLSGLAHILGRNLEKRVKSARLFVVGAGAIGCELLKNLAAMGVATGKKGSITLTDMDTIEKSNLSRQLLFRDNDIGEFKSVAAHAAILRFNPAVKMEIHTGKVGDNDHGPFDDEFWSSGMEYVLNALDNMEARLFIDQQCVANGKALVDAGTLGSKGNVQVVVPFQSESYGSSVDPPEPAIPVCTLKNFPYAISHTIQWGRDLFDGLFQRRPSQANDYAESLTADAFKELAISFIRDLGEAAAVDTAQELQEDLSYAAIAESGPLAVVRQNAIEWAVTLATRLFRDAIDELLQEHPEDSLDEDGEPFWSGTRKVPRPLSFSAEASTKDAFQSTVNENLVEFVKSASRLRIEMLTGVTEAALVTEADAKGALTKYQGRRSDTGKDTEEESSPKTTVLKKLKTIPGGPRKDLTAVEFEKDDESNGHVQFVAAASNLRAICYGIPPVDAMETRRVAGKIVPAMITTTAVVSALSCVELLKLLQDAPLTRYRNAFINLALPFFAFTVPVPAEEMPGPQGKTFTVWDSIVIDEKKKTLESKGLTLKRFIKKLKKAVSEDPESLEVSTVSAGQYMIYANFLHEGDKDVLRQSVWDLVEKAASEEDDEFLGRGESLDSDNDNSVGTAARGELELTVSVEDTTTGEEFELPPVRIRSVVDLTESKQAR